MTLRVPKIHFTRRTGRIVLAIGVTVLLLCALAAWQVPKVVRGLLTTDVSQMLGREVAVGKIHFNPFTLTLRAHDLSVIQPESPTPLLQMAQLELSASWTSLLWFAPVVDAVVLREPKVAIVRDGATHFNFSDITQRIAQMSANKEAEPPGADYGWPRFSLNNLLVQDGALTLDDAVTGRRHVIDQLEIGVPFISTFGYATDIDVQPRLHLRINGSPFDLKGVARPFDKVPSSTLRVAFTGLELEKWADVWPLALPFKLERGLLDSDLDVVFEQPKEAAATIKVRGNIGLRRVDVRDVSGKPFLAFSALNVERLSFLPAESRVAIGEVALWSPQIMMTRDKSQRINWVDIINKLARLGQSSSAQTPVSPSAEPPVENAVAPPWDIALDAVNVHDGEATVNDAGLRLDYTLTGVALTLEDIVLPPNPERPIAAWLSVDNSADGAWLRAKGELSMQSLGLDLTLDMGNVALAPFASMVRSLSPVQIDKGRLAAQARVQLQLKGASMDVVASTVKAGLTNLRTKDQSVNPAVPLQIDTLTLTADRLALNSDQSAFKLQASGVQGAGRVALQGKFSLLPLRVKTQATIQNLDLASFAPYVAGSLNATVRAVSVGAQGELEFAAATGAAPMASAWRGSVDISGLDLEDRVNSDDFLKWQNLRLANMAIVMAGSKLDAHLGDVSLDDFYGRVLLNAKGRLNVMDLVAEPGQAGGSITQDTQTRGRRTSASSTGATPAISVASVMLRGGNVTFTDRFVKPNYTAELSKIEGTVSGVSSSAPKPAQVQLSGKVYNSAPFSISGMVQPFSQFLALDLKATAKGVDLPRFTTYSAKYVGYPIKRGKLSLDLQYQIKDRALQANNKVVLNQLTFGDRVESPDATKLPVMLAVALLKDSKGNIDINLPISGSLDDPEFSVGGIVGRVVVNLLVKAVSSPFSLLASAFGGGEELSFIEFEPGSAQLTEAGMERIATLSTALNDRPALKMDISGRADPQTDMEGLRQAWIEEQLRLAKARAGGGKGKKADISGVQVSAAERQKYLEKVYGDTDIQDKPRNLLGFAKSVPAQEMEALLRAAAPVDTDQLRLLADARAQAVFEQLEKTGPVDRMFIVAARLDADGIKDEGKSSRVDFSLR